LDEDPKKKFYESEDNLNEKDKEKLIFYVKEKTALKKYNDLKF
jgi:hypothetical protein